MFGGILSAVYSCNRAKEIICTPIYVVTFPLRYLIDKVKLVFQKFLGFFLRITIFMHGVYNDSWLTRQIVELYKSGCERSRAPFDAKRLESSRSVFKNLGAEIKFATTPDGNEVEYCHIKYENVKKKIEEKGGKWVELPVQSTVGPKESVEVIYSDKPTKEWEDFSKNVLSRMGWKEIVLDIAGKKIPAFQTAKWNEDQQRPEEKQCFLRSHSPTSSWAAERSYTGMHLGLHADLCLYDYRGTYNSKGTPSEGGYYSDIETIYQTMRAHYPTKKIWSSGFCLGGAVAISLLKAHNDEGLNLVTENTFDKIEKVVNRYPWPFRALGRFALPQIQANVRSKVPQDFFNSVGKLESLSPAKDAGTRIIINSHPDTMMEEDAKHKLCSAAQKSGKTFQFVHTGHGHKNGHSLNPLDDPKIWEGYVAALAERNPTPVKTGSKVPT